MTSNEISRRASAAVNSFGLRKKKDIEIIFDGQQDFVPTYTTLQKIQGNVNVKFEKDLAFDKIEILFLGRTDTWVERVQSMTPAAGRVVAKHDFLKSSQPLDLSRLPEDGIAKADVTYSHPFSFIVPEKLLDVACQHKTLTKIGNSDPTKEQHLLLPPSLGDCMVSGAGSKLMSDMAPDMSKISYSIKVMLKKLSVVVASQSQKIRIVPAREAQPPLEIPEHSLDYRVRVDIGVKKGSLFPFAKVGRLVAEVAQPPALMLPPPNTESTCPITSSTTLNLRFDPKDAKSSPPTLDNLSVKLRVFTFFATDRFPNIASKSLCQDWHTERNHYSEEVEISHRPVSTVDWTRHSSLAPCEANMSRQDSYSSTTSRASTDNTPLPSKSSSSGLPFYTAQIRVPIILPSSQTSRKVFPPTFHSCFISRTYTLRLHLSYQTPKKSLPYPSLNLKVPIQIGSHGIPDARPVISEAEMDSIRAREEFEREMTEIDEFYRPRRGTLIGEGDVDADAVPSERLRMMSIGDSSNNFTSQNRHTSLISNRSGESDTSIHSSTSTSSSSSSTSISEDPTTTTTTMTNSNNPFHPENLSRHLSQPSHQSHEASSLPSYTSLSHNHHRQPSSPSQSQYQSTFTTPFLSPNNRMSFSTTTTAPTTTPRTTADVAVAVAMGSGMSNMTRRGWLDMPTARSAGAIAIYH